MDRLTVMELKELAKERNIKIKSSMRKQEIIDTIRNHANSYAYKRDRIKNDLLDQLERDGTVGEFYTDLINDYMALWDVKNKLILDIEEKGVSVKYQNGQNQFGYKKNDSVAELQRTNNQMLRLLEHLGLKPSRQDGAGEDFGEIPEM